MDAVTETPNPRSTVADSEREEKSTDLEVSGSDNAHYGLPENAPRRIEGINPEDLWQQIRQTRWKAAAEEAARRAQQPLAFEPAQRTIDGHWEGLPAPQVEDFEPVSADVPESPGQCGPELWHRQEQLALALEQAGMAKRGERHRLCNRTWNTWGCSACGADSYAAIATCDLRVCVSCQRRKSKEIAAKLRERVRALPKVRGYKLRLITLTIKTNGADDMRRAIELLGTALPKLWRKTLGRRRLKTGGFVRLKSAGALFAMEAGGRLGNIHCHGLYFGPFIAQAEISDAWAELTGSPVVDVRLARGEKVIAEVCKYVCDPTLPVHLQAALEKALEGTRRIRTYGSFYGVEPADVPECRRRCPHCGVVGQLELTGTTYLAAPAARASGPPGSSRPTTPH